jgi:hypothetical protein
MADKEVAEKLAKVGIKVYEEQIKKWSEAEKQAATGWVDLVLAAEKQKDRGIEEKEKKIAVPQKPDFLRVY